MHEAFGGTQQTHNTHSVGMHLWARLSSHSLRGTQFSGAAMTLEFGRQTGADPRRRWAGEPSTAPTTHRPTQGTSTALPPATVKRLQHFGLVLEMCFSPSPHATAHVVCPPHPFLCISQGSFAKICKHRACLVTTGSLERLHGLQW